jgi:hypothetical protein
MEVVVALEQFRPLFLATHFHAIASFFSDQLYRLFRSFVLFNASLFIVCLTYDTMYTFRFFVLVLIICLNAAPSNSPSLSRFAFELCSLL